MSRRARQRVNKRRTWSGESQDTMAIVLRHATALTAQEVSSIMAPLQLAHRHLREGVATEREWMVLASSINVALRIEQQGVVRGLQEHMQVAEKALAEIHVRAMAGGTWRQTALHYHELDAVREAIDLHDWQIRQLSWREFRRAVESEIGDVRRQGGVILKAQPQPTGAST